MVAYIRPAGLDLSVSIQLIFRFTALLTPKTVTFLNFALGADILIRMGLKNDGFLLDVLPKTEILLEYYM